MLNAYLACIAATTGDLLTRLRADPDDQPVDAACQIVSALIPGGPPVEDIHDYPEAPQAVLELLRILATQGSTVAHVRLAAAVQWFLEDREHGPRDDAGWTRAFATRGLCGQIKSHPQWQAYLVGLTSPDQHKFEMSMYVAQALGQDVYDHRVRFLRSKPTHTGPWSVLTHGAAGQAPLAASSPRRPSSRPSPASPSTNCESSCGGCSPTSGYTTSRLTAEAMSPYAVGGWAVASSAGTFPPVMGV